MTRTKHIAAGLIISCAALYTTTSQAIPSLQLSGDGSADWGYDTSDSTWVSSGTTSFDLLAHANATRANGGNGDLAWDAAGSTDRYAYLVVAAVPNLGTSDSFDISINGGSITMLTSGYGTPPLEDPNSIPRHGIYDTYFEIYEFQFDGPIVDIKDEQPGSTGTGKGYTETLGIDILSWNQDILGLHFDLFTVSGDGIYDPNANLTDRFLVNAFAPHSHDAEWIPEPGVLLLLGLGLTAIGFRQFLVKR